MSYITNLKLAAKRFGLLAEDEIADDNSVANAIEDGECEERWLTVIYSEEREINLGGLHAEKSDAFADLAGTVHNPYGYQPVALVDLESGDVFEQLAIEVQSGPVTAWLGS